tara:strand:+ start:1061 stop:1222 length:162 start_codon:yes stop_codon:yes gene_type:complete
MFIYIYLLVIKMAEIKYYMDHGTDKNALAAFLEYQSDLFIEIRKHFKKRFKKN